MGKRASSYFAVSLVAVSIFLYSSLVLCHPRDPFKSILGDVNSNYNLSGKLLPFVIMLQLCNQQGKHNLCLEDQTIKVSMMNFDDNLKRRSSFVHLQRRIHHGRSAVSTSTVFRVKIRQRTNYIHVHPRLS